MSLTIESLKFIGFSDDMIDIWKKAGIFTLLPLQEKLLTNPEFFSNNDMMIIAPTSSGKTLLAQILALYHLKDMKKVVYLVPTKALAEEKYRSFVALFKEFGFRIAIATRDRPESDEDVLSGNFDLLIAVYEKLKAYLVIKPELINQISLLVADEIQIIADPTRGAMVDALLSKIAAVKKNMRMLFLSAVVGKPEIFSDWLGIKPIVYEQRPVELREGVFVVDSGEFVYRNFNGKDVYHEHLFHEGKTPCDEPADNYMNAHLELIRYLSVNLNEQVLVFLPMKFMTMSWAQQFASLSSFASAQECLAQLELQEPSVVKRELCKMLKSGIAFHNSDLSQEQRLVVENGFQCEEIRVLFSTSTLAQGINIGGRNVICSLQKVGKDDVTGRTISQNLERAEFRNQGGRAGRFGREMEYGRAIIVAPDKYKADIIMNEYILQPIEPMPSSFSENDFCEMFLDLASANIISGEKDCGDFIKKTYFYAFNSKARKFAEDWDNKHKLLFSSVLSQLEKCGHIEQMPDGKIRVTGLGKTASTFGLKIQTSLLFYEIIKSAADIDRMSFLDFILIASDSADGREIYIPVARFDTPFNVLMQLKKRYDDDKIPYSDYLKRFLDLKGGFTKDDISVLKRALLMIDWVTDIPTEIIEKEQAVHLGAIQNIAQQFEWLFDAWGFLSETIAAPTELTSFFKSIAMRMKYGVSEDGLEIAKLNVPNLTRGYIFKLIRQNITRVGIIKSLKSSDLLKMILPESLARRLYSKVMSPPQIQIPNRFSPQEGSGDDKTSNEDSNASDIGKVKEADLKAESEKDYSKIPLVLPVKSPGIIFLYGKKIYLKPKAYSLLYLLAQKPGFICTYETIDEAVWQDEKVERQQVTQHKANIIEEFEKAVGKKKAEELIITKTKYGLILNLNPDDIKFES